MATEFFFFLVGSPGELAFAIIASLCSIFLLLAVPLQAMISNSAHISGEEVVTMDTVKITPDQEPYQTRIYTEQKVDCSSLVVPIQCKVAVYSKQAQKQAV